MSDKDFFNRRAEYYKNMGLAKYENSAGAWLWADGRIAELTAERDALKSQLEDEQSRPEYSHEAQHQLDALREAAQATVDEWRNGCSVDRILALEALLNSEEG